LKIDRYFFLRKKKINIIFLNGKNKYIIYKEKINIFLLKGKDKYIVTKKER